MPLKPVAILAWLVLYGLLALLPMGLALGIERPPPRGLLVEIGAILGLLGLGMLATQLVTSGRQRWFAAGVGQDNLLQFHRRTGLMAWILVLVHPLLLMVETRLWRPWHLRRHPWRVAEVEVRRAGSTRLVLEADGHPGMAFKPGQFAWLTLGDTPFSLQQHPFSMSSSPTHPTRLEFIVKQAGDFTRRLAIMPGTRLGRLHKNPRRTQLSTEIFRGDDGHAPLH
jgi:predicted ferric reductase